MVFTKVMPAGNSAGGSGSQQGGGGRTTFRPPWVKEGPQPIPMPAAPWTLTHRAKETAPATQTEAPGQPQRRSSKITIVPSQPTENGTPVIREVSSRPSTNTQLASQEVKVPVQRESMTRPPLTNQKTVSEVPVKVETTVPVNRAAKVVPVKVETTVPVNRAAKEVPVKVETTVPVKRDTKPPPLPQKDEQVKVQARETIEKAIPVSKPPIVKQNSVTKIPPPPTPPMPPPPPPKMLPPDHKPLSHDQQSKIEALKARPRKRPDWATMMKEVEEGKKLKHVVCNDRSQPLLPAGKAKTKDGKFIYDSEKSNIHNQLLRQIQSGVKLKCVQTNDRSRPVLEGLRQFRRQMTIEEQIQKSQSVAKIAEAIETGEIVVVDDELLVDELDDIDNLRDELQSSKQLLALELRNKEAQIRENKRLQARILNLEVELEREKGRMAATVTRGVLQERMEDEQLVVNLKEEAEVARKAAKDMEKKYLQATDMLDTTKGELEESKRQNEILEKRLEAALRLINGDGSRRESQAPKGDGDNESEPEEANEESESDDDGDEEEKQEKRLKREIKILVNKLTNFKDKEGNARRERTGLREQMKKQQELIKEERKKYKALQREVDKMAALMKDDIDMDADDEEEKEEGDDEENEEVSEEETETESESESSSDSEEEESESESEDSPFDKRKENYTGRIRKHESCLAALKKGNYLLKANIDRLKDDLNKQREEIVTLKQDLDSVLSELG